MSNERLIGVTSLLIGATSYNTTTGVYSMPSTFTTLTAIVPDSVKINIDMPEPTEFDTEESDFPDTSVPGKTKITGEFATFDAGASIFALLMGGTASGATVFKAMSTSATIREKSIRVVTKTTNGKYHTIDMPRVSLRAGGELAFAKSKPGQLTGSFSVLFAGTNTPPFKKTRT